MNTVDFISEIEYVVEVRRELLSRASIGLTEAKTALDNNKFEDITEYYQDGVSIETCATKLICDVIEASPKPDVTPIFRVAMATILAASILYAGVIGYLAWVMEGAY